LVQLAHLFLEGEVCYLVLVGLVLFLFSEGCVFGLAFNMTLFVLQGGLLKMCAD
jgi:hypothetical protein